MHIAKEPSKTHGLYNSAYRHFMHMHKAQDRASQNNNRAHVPHFAHSFAGRKPYCICAGAVSINLLIINY